MFLSGTHGTPGSLKDACQAHMPTSFGEGWVFSQQCSPQKSSPYMKASDAAARARGRGGGALLQRVTSAAELLPTADGRWRMEAQSRQ